MALLISFLVGLQVLYSLAHPPRPHPANQFSSPSCNSSVVIAAAEEALNKINADRREGYAIGLQRIFEIRKLPQGRDKYLFYFTLDVLETECHVLSRKSWKECDFRPSHKTVYGQCIVIISTNENGKLIFLHKYDCLLRPISSRVIALMCPDCPTRGDPKEAKYQEAAAESLAKFNAENNHVHCFAILNVTKASSQWVVGDSNFVEFTMQETSCSKSKCASDLSNCSLLPPETAETGLCTGSVVNSQIEHRKFISVKCDFFPPRVPEQTPQTRPQPEHPGHHSNEEDHEGDHHHHHHHDHQRGKGHHHHPHHSGPPHDKHLHKQHGDHQQEKTVGKVVVLPPSNEHVSLHSLPEIGAEQLDGKPVPAQVQEPKSSPSPSFPEREGSHEEEGHPPHKPDRPGFGKHTRPDMGKSTQSDIPPYPIGFSDSPTCPGESIVNIYGVNLPERPVIKSPPGGGASLA